MRATWLTLKEGSVSSQMELMTAFERMNVCVEWLSLIVLFYSGYSWIISVCNCWWAVSFTSVIILALRSVGFFLKAQILNHLGMGQTHISKCWKWGSLVVFFTWTEGKLSSGLCDLCACVSFWGVLAPTGTPCTRGRWIWWGILESSSSCLVLWPSAACGESLVSETKWPQPKALSKHQEKGCHGKEMEMKKKEMEIPVFFRRRTAKTPASPVFHQLWMPHCSEQCLPWSRMQFMFSEHSQCDGNVWCPCAACGSSCWHWGRGSGWHRVFPDSSAHFSAELEMLLVLYLKYLQLTWSDLIILWWCLAAPARSHCAWCRQSNHRQLRGAYSWKLGCTSDKPWRSSTDPQLWCCSYLSSIFKPALRCR